MKILLQRRRVERVDALAALAAAGAPGDGDCLLLDHPASGRARVGVGRIAAVAAGGPDRFREASTRAAALLARVESAGDPGPTAAGPALLGGFAFDDRPGSGAWRGFGSADLVLPELLLVSEDDASWLCALGTLRSGGEAASRSRLDARIAAWQHRIQHTAPLPRPAAVAAQEHRVTPDRAPAAFCETVEDGIDAIAAGEFEKVVLARSLSVTRPGGFAPLELLRDLRASLPTSATFLVGRADGIFLGATPERLLRRDGRSVRTAAVAGTAARGRNPEEDRRLARALVESKKEQAEHDVVLRFLRERLAEHADEVEHLEAPELLPLEGMQHLRTPVTARLRSDVSALELAGALHPTPAVCGAPAGPALAFLREYESLDRGWYAGPIGWTDAAGDGEFWVALRCGLLRGDSVRLFAGAGVVADSNPAAELRETRLKLATLLPRLLDV